MIPYAFIRIEILRVSREFLQMDVIGTTMVHKDVYLFCPMDACTIPERQKFAAEVLTQVTQKGDTVHAGHRTRTQHGRQLSGRGDATHHRGVITGLDHFQQWRFTNRRISPNRAWQQAHSRFVNTDYGSALALRLFSALARPRRAIA